MNMEKYKFEIRKMSTNTVEVKAENCKDAVLEAIYLLITKDREIFEKSKDRVINYDIILEEFKRKDDMKYLKNVKEILQKIDDSNGKISVEIEEEVNDLDKECDIIICQRCGNCIELDEDFMS